MEFLLSEDNIVEDPNDSENFEKSVLGVLENNGVLNDLRAYLRAHLISILRSTQGGKTSTCHQLFKHRLDYKVQALNILVAEYLLKQDFHYTLSVFVTETPLANMIFKFAKSLLKSDLENASNLQICENDICSILNYLGIQCDSDDFSNVVDMYKKEDNKSLLMCILHSLSFHRIAAEYSSEEDTAHSVTTTEVSGENLDRRNLKRTYTCKNIAKDCKHSKVCKLCHNKTERLKKSFNKRKQKLQKIYDQKIAAHESEMESIRSLEQRKLKCTLANHINQLKKKHEEMKEHFKLKEVHLENRNKQKKRFLWGLACTLKEQHSLMVEAMNNVHNETKRLSAKENNIKLHLKEAEEFLKKAAVEMHNQIENEITKLERHFEAMKIERDKINKEREELNNAKLLPNENSKDLEKELELHYNLLKNEIILLKAYLNTTKFEPKLVIESSTNTELDVLPAKVDILNNQENINTTNDEFGIYNEINANKRPSKIISNQVVNDLKKEKNVHFTIDSPHQLNDFLYPDMRRLIETSKDDIGLIKGALEKFQAENSKLNTLIAEQHRQIDDLTLHHMRLQADYAVARSDIETLRISQQSGSRPTPLIEHMHLPQQRTTSTFGQQKGGGEALDNIFNANPTIVLPGDSIPFYGKIAGNRVLDGRRCSVQRHSNKKAYNLVSHQEAATEDANGRSQADEKIPTRNIQPEEIKTQDVTSEHIKKKSISAIIDVQRKLKQLEIEANAVHKSYTNFKKKVYERKECAKPFTYLNNETIFTKDEVQKSIDPVVTVTTPQRNGALDVLDIQNYLRHCKMDEIVNQFAIKTTSENTAKPIPENYKIFKTAFKSNKFGLNLIDTPLCDFRKLYNIHTKTVKSKSKCVSAGCGSVINIKPSIRPMTDTKPDTSIIVTVPDVGTNTKLKKSLQIFIPTPEINNDVEPDNNHSVDTNLEDKNINEKLNPNENKLLVEIEKVVDTKHIIIKQDEIKIGAIVNDEQKNQIIEPSGTGQMDFHSTLESGDCRPKIEKAKSKEKFVSDSDKYNSVSECSDNYLYDAKSDKLSLISFEVNDDDFWDS